MRNTLVASISLEEAAGIPPDASKSGVGGGEGGGVCKRTSLNRGVGCVASKIKRYMDLAAR